MKMDENRHKQEFGVSIWLADSVICTNVDHVSIAGGQWL